MAGTAINEDRKRAHFTFIWAIKNAARGAFLKSPVFSVQSMEMTKWNLIIYAYKDRRVISCVERAGEDDGPKSIEVEFELSFLDINGSSSVKKSGTRHFQNYINSGWLELPETDVISKQSKTKVYPRITLTARCRMWRTRTEISKSELCFATTRFDVHKHSCFWAVKEFSSLKLGEERILTLNSISEGWREPSLTLFLDKNDDKECVFIHIGAPCKGRYIDIDAEIAVLNTEGKDFLSKRISASVDTRSQICAFSVFEKDELMSHKAILLSEDVLLLRCEVLYSYRLPIFNRIEGFKLMEYTDSKLLQTGKSEMSLDEVNETAVCPFKEIINGLKDDGTLSDVCLRAGNKSFPVHKLILSSRSPVFKAMFTKDMRESTSKCIDIPDLDAVTLNRLLLYIYDDQIKEITWETAANLFEAADKYELLDLKEKCSSFLKKNLSISNACDILVLADMHQEESLRRSALEFMQNNSEIIYSDGWKIFKKNYSKLAWDTAEEIIYTKKLSRS